MNYLIGLLIMTYDIPFEVIQADYFGKCLGEWAIGNDLIASDEIIIWKEGNYKHVKDYFNKYKLLLKDAPSIHHLEIWRKHDYNLFQDRIKFANQYIQFLKDQQELYPRNKKIIDQIIKETEYLIKLNENIRHLQYYGTVEHAVKRKILLELRNYLGNELFLAGYLPPCVPIEYFQEIRN